MKPHFVNVLNAVMVLAGIGVWIEPARADGLFPDKSLEAAVRHEVYEKRDKDTPLTEDDVKNISTIVAKRKGIKDLAGLEKCRSLALLDLEGNEITILAPLQGLKNLQSLDLSGNKIKDLAPLAELTRLQLLQLASNEISDLAPLANLTSLNSLYLSKNKIADIRPLGGLKKLWSLYLDENQIEDIKALESLKNLNDLSLSGNKVADISSLASLTELRGHLFLEKNKITDLAVLVSMAAKDAEKEKRFAPFWHIYVAGNPLSDAARGEQIARLKELGGKVQFEKNEKSEKKE